MDVDLEMIAHSSCDTFMILICAFVHKVTQCAVAINHKELSAKFEVRAGRRDERLVFLG